MRHYSFIGRNHERKNVDAVGAGQHVLHKAFVPWNINKTQSNVVDLKIGKTKIDSHLAAYQKQMMASNWAEMPPYFVTSSESGLGKEALLAYIGDINESIFKNEA